MNFNLLINIFEISSKVVNLHSASERSDMKALRVAIIILFTLLTQASKMSAQKIEQYTRTEKPWTYWWWMGSAVDETNITHQLRSFAKAGFGGVHIIPIYGVKGYETRAIPFMSRRWMAMLEFTIAEADSFGLGVDMTTGTGWPFGGPQVSIETSAKRYLLEAGHFTSIPTKQTVKRAAPGGEGLVVDHFDRPAVRHYLNAFDSSLNRVRNKLRCLYNDSYEVYGANWTTGFLSDFKKKRGYNLEERIDDFLDTTQTFTGTQVKIDYHQTLAELLHDNFTTQWTTWAKSHSFMTRNQAHGSPGNLLDLYALADIPETESFGTSGFPIPGLRIDEHYQVSRFGTPDPLAMKFASSAANLTGKKFVSSESGTWLGDHFKVSLSQVKPQLDELFTAGINHVFYHGITYSPKEEGFPGWLFYASTNFGLQSHVWKHLDALNKYVTRCQHLLQNSEPDNDILVYFQVHDLWATKPRAEGGVHLLEVHHTQKWLRPSAFGKLATSLLENGFSFDYVSDSLLLDVNVTKGRSITSGKTVYKIVLVPPVRFIPARTLHILRTLADRGAVIVFQDHLPNGPAGLLAATNSTTFQRDIDALRKNAIIIPEPNLPDELFRLGAQRESFAAIGLSFIRKKQQRSDSSLYFISNLGDNFTSGWIPVAGKYSYYRTYDPLTHSFTPLAARKNEQNRTEVFLDLPPGKSCFLLPSKINTDNPAAAVNTTKFPLRGKWAIRFEDGLPHIKETFRLDTLRSWTALSDSASFFYGTARYDLDFSLPDSIVQSGHLSIDLGRVCEVAEVTLNGKPLGIAWSIPYSLDIPAKLLRRNNSLQIRVSNLSANYMKLYDKIHPEWKKFHDINIVDIQYKPYDASQSGIMPSGLTSEVSIRYH